jgi:hypothetical protein
MYVQCTSWRNGRAVARQTKNSQHRRQVRASSASKHKKTRSLVRTARDSLPALFTLRAGPLRESARISGQRHTTPGHWLRQPEHADGLHEDQRYLDIWMRLLDEISGLATLDSKYCVYINIVIVPAFDVTAACQHRNSDVSYPKQYIHIQGRHCIASFLSKPLRSSPATVSAVLCRLHLRSAYRKPGLVLESMDPLMHLSPRTPFRLVR